MTTVLARDLVDRAPGDEITTGVYLTYTGTFVRAFSSPKGTRVKVLLRTVLGCNVWVLLPASHPVELVERPLAVGQAVVYAWHWDPTREGYLDPSVGQVVKSGRDTKKRIVFCVKWHDGREIWHTRANLMPLPDAVVFAYAPMLLTRKV